jgi:hypothetical protein
MCAIIVSVEMGDAVLTVIVGSVVVDDLKLSESNLNASIFSFIVLLRYTLRMS